MPVWQKDCAFFFCLKMEEEPASEEVCFFKNFRRLTKSKNEILSVSHTSSSKPCSAENLRFFKHRQYVQFCQIYTNTLIMPSTYKPCSRKQTISEVFRELINLYLATAGHIRECKFNNHRSDWNM
jgi:hypothetical protein